MMKRLNEIRIIGRVAQVGEIKPTANNLLYKFSIAVDGKKTSFLMLSHGIKLPHRVVNYYQRAKRYTLRATLSRIPGKIRKQELIEV